MEDLTKTQIVLLCLLVSFVTSIGTGIISFSLLSEAPQTVTQTINKVVERTIETVVPTVIPGEKTIEKEVTTVVIKEEDLIIDVIEKGEQSIVRISTVLDDVSANATTTYGLGVFVSKEGMIVSDAHSAPAKSTYIATLANGKTYTLTPVTALVSNPEIVFFNLKKDTDDTFVFTPVTFGNSSALKLGQTVIAISGAQNTLVSVGRVTSLKKSTVNGSSGTVLSGIETDITPKDTLTGGPLFTLAGEFVGISTLGATGSTAPPFLPSNVIQTALSNDNSAASN